MFHPNGAHLPYYHTFVATRDQIVSTLLGDVEWAKAQLVVQSIQAMESKRPTEPEVLEDIYTWVTSYNELRDNRHQSY